MKVILGIFVLVFVGFSSLVLMDKVAWGTWRYKITVEVETPEGVKTGSAVREVSAYTNIARWVNPDVGSLSINVKGEAVVIDLGKHGVVFGLIDWGSYEEFFSAFPRPKGTELVPYYNTIKEGTIAPLPAERWPQFVMFKDIKDPKSVTLVKGGRFNVEKQDFDPVDDFEAIFGVGVQLKSIIIEATDEDVTWGLKKIMPWLDGHYNKQLDGNRFISSNEIANNLSSGSFSTGEKK